MTALRGRAHIKIDDKGRLSLPTIYRMNLGTVTELIITNGFFRSHRFLDLYSMAEWRKLEKKVETLPNFKIEVQTFRRLYLSSGIVCEVDSQGRLLIPQHLRNLAQIGSEIVMVGMGQKIEIWDEETWNKLFTHAEKEFDQVLSVLAELEEKKKK